MTEPAAWTCDDEQYWTTGKTGTCGCEQVCAKRWRRVGIIPQGGGTE